MKLDKSNGINFELTERYWTCCPHHPHPKDHLFRSIQWPDLASGWIKLGTRTPCWGPRPCCLCAWHRFHSSILVILLLMWPTNAQTQWQILKLALSLWPKKPCSEVVYCICSDPAYSGGGPSHGTTCPDRRESGSAGSAALLAITQ